MSQIEEIAEYHDGDKVWRTSCVCMGDDNLTFTVATDEEFPEVYLEMWTESSTLYQVHDYDGARWTHPFRAFWRRLKGACTVMFKGYVTVNCAFIFRGEKHIDEFTDTIQEHKKYLIKRRGEVTYNDGKVKN